MIAESYIERVLFTIYTGKKRGVMKKIGSFILRLPWHGHLE